MRKGFRQNKFLKAEGWHLSPVVMEIIDQIANGGVRAVLQQTQAGPLPRAGEVALECRRACV